MSGSSLEHVNITVSDPDRTATMLCTLFDWKIRWQGKPGQSIDGGTSMHVGGPQSYVAIYSQREVAPVGNSYVRAGSLNHIGVTVEDLEIVEGRVKEMGFKPHNHGDYEPGRRFYFHDHDGIEFEVISYS